MSQSGAAPEDIFARQQPDRFASLLFEELTVRREGVTEVRVRGVDGELRVCVHREIESWHLSPPASASAEVRFTVLFAGG